MEVTGIEHHNLQLGWIIALEEFCQDDLIQLIDLVSELGMPKINYPVFKKKRGQFVHGIYADTKEHFSFFYRPKMKSALIIWKHSCYTGEEIVSMLFSLIR